MDSDLALQTWDALSGWEGSAADEGPRLAQTTQSCSVTLQRGSASPAKVCLRGCSRVCVQLRAYVCIHLFDACSTGRQTLVSCIYILYTRQARTC